MVIVVLAPGILLLPEYVAVMLISAPASSSGTVYSIVAVPLTTFAYSTLPLASFNVLPLILNTTLPTLMLFPASSNTLAVRLTV